MQQLQSPKKGYKYEKFLFGRYEEIPQSWTIAKFIELCRDRPMYGAAVPASKKNHLLPRYIRITDLNEDGSLRHEEWMSISEEDARPYILSEGDILFARTGATVGKTYLYRKEDGSNGSGEIITAAMANFGIPLTGSMAMGFAFGFMRG